MEHVLNECRSTGNLRRRFKNALTRSGLPRLITSDTVQNLLLGTSRIELRLKEMNKAVRRQLDAARKHLAMEIKLKFP